MQRTLFRGTSASCSAVLLFVCGALAGCGGVDDPFERVPVKGTVQVDGQPLQYGQIFLTGEKDAKTQQAAQTILLVRDGAFDSQARGTTPGSNEVVVTVYDGDPSSEDDEVVVNATGSWTSQVDVAADQPVKIEIPKSELKKPTL